MVDRNRRKVLRLLATTPLLSGAAGSLLAACNRDPAPSADPETEAPKGPSLKTVVRPQPVPWELKEATQKLTETLGFASLHNRALLIDFGTTDCLKYIMGGWRTGWGKHLSRDGVAYTHATSETSRIHFHWDKSEALIARFRLQRVAATYVSLYVNNKPVEKIDISRVDWTTYDKPIPAELVRAGVNHVLLRWEKTVPAMGEDVAAAVDYVQFEAAPAAEATAKAPEPVLPRQSAVLKTIEEGGHKGEALALSDGMRLSYWLQIPDLPGGMLGLTAGVLAGADKAQPGGAAATPMKLTIAAHSDEEQPRELHAAEVAPGGFQPLGVDLDALRGQTVRLDLSATGGDGGQLLMLEPALYATVKKPQKTKPQAAAKNVIVVMIDTLRADHTRTYADTRVKAPAFEAFAKAGAVFDRYSAVEDWTKPSCATMLTGLYPVSHRTQTDSAKLPEAVRMVSQELKAQGVTTAAFIANGYVSDKFGFKRAWDHYTNYIRETRNTEAEKVFGEAYAWITEQKAAGKRFYTYVHTIDPHVPYDPPDEFYKLYDDSEPQAGDVKSRSTGLLLEDIKKGRFTPSVRDKARIRALYDGEISYHDKWFGDFLEKLDGQGLLEDTLVIALSDHGEEFWEHGSVGHGHQIHQELIHVPFVMHWKGTIDGGLRVAENTDHCTLVPTIYDAMGLEAPSYLEGASVLPAALGVRATGPHAGFSTHQNDREAVWAGRFKLVQNGPVNTFLYDVDKDRNCQQNLMRDRPIALCYMRALLGHFQGADNKLRWRSRELEKAVASRVKEEKIEVDPETRKQLENLGYFQ